MKVKVVIDIEKEEEITIQCRQVTPDLKKLIEFLENKNQKLEAVSNQNQKVYVHPMDVLYIESVDGITYIYTTDNVFKLKMTLQELEDTYQGTDYFRGAKNLIINIQHVESLKSQLNGRIIVTMDNEELLVVSRHYARLLKEKLKGEK
ncbi:LytTR family DNA-binding domain-containing protein [Anaerorhabdus furcosa]|uniref:LytTr DNA-binding domain-containing protein n=1 Tax=Anaerorhabdus furcosa TaxID=118967 RepID=A0A1T4KEI6_9FIRM|nr:LytTR family DNA-binding domain-containing protein [Anaerorhabdus furcosa]SJZ40878.1 LytTr DNA-binding domain-containing protein [Anaerorhabdus furcosa]